MTAYWSWAKIRSVDARRLAKPNGLAWVGELIIIMIHLRIGLHSISSFLS